MPGCDTNAYDVWNFELAAHIMWCLHTHRNLHYLATVWSLFNTELWTVSTDTEVHYIYSVSPVSFSEVSRFIGWLAQHISQVLAVILESHGGAPHISIQMAVNLQYPWLQIRTADLETDLKLGTLLWK